VRTESGESDESKRQQGGPAGGPTPVLFYPPEQPIEQFFGHGLNPPIGLHGRCKIRCNGGPTGGHPWHLPFALLLRWQDLPRLLPAGARTRPLVLTVMLIAAFIALAWLKAPPPGKPGDLGLFIGDMRIARRRR
jgi:hypothetical protein